MTDPATFPGTEMTVFEKYTGSRRLDHPNFGDVSKTTFAKGVITEFQQITDDPITVKSMVKVEVEGVESGYIPIFFNPKAQYWDSDGTMAQDFDADTGTFKHAWMSFRGGDEVVVMLKEGVPVAVMGFADGKPRIGEALVEFNFPWFGEEFWETDKMIKNDDGKVGEIYRTIYEGYEYEPLLGPDGKEAKVIEECTIEACAPSEVPEGGPPPTDETYEHWDRLGGNGEYSQQYEEGVPIYAYWYEWSGYQKTTITEKYYYIVITVPIGPIKYKFYYRIFHAKVVYDQQAYLFEWSKEGVTIAEITPPVPDDRLKSPAEYGFEANGQCSTGYHEEVCPYGDNNVLSDTLRNIPAPDEWDDYYDITLIKITACQYNKDEEIDQRSWWEDWGSSWGDYYDVGGDFGNFVLSAISAHVVAHNPSE